MTSFWLTRGSLCPLWPSCLIWYPWSLFLLGFCGSTPLWLTVYLLHCSFSIFKGAPTFTALSQSHHRHPFLSVQFFFSLVFCYYSQAEHFHLPALTISILFCELNWQFDVFRTNPCHLKLKKITGNSFIWTCHSSSSAHCCWHLHHSLSDLKLRISLTFPCMFLCPEIIMAGLLQNHWELGKSGKVIKV